MSAPWNVPCTSAPPLGIPNPSLPAIQVGDCTNIVSEATQISASLAASLGFTVGNEDAKLNYSYWTNEFIWFQEVPPPSSGWPEGVEEVFAGFGFRMLIQYGSASSTTALNLSEVAANIQLDSGAFSAQFQHIGVPSTSKNLAPLLANMEKELSPTSTFNVATFTNYMIALQALLEAYPQYPDEITPGLVGMSVVEYYLDVISWDAGAPLVLASGSSIYALWKIAYGYNLQHALDHGKKETIPAPPLTGTASQAVDLGTIQSVYESIMGVGVNPNTDPNSEQISYAKSLLSFGK